MCIYKGLSYLVITYVSLHRDISELKCVFPLKYSPIIINFKLRVCLAVDSRLLVFGKAVEKLQWQMLS